MHEPYTITGSSTDAAPLDVPALTAAGFTWLHLEGASYLRVPQGASIESIDIVVTVVGVTDSGTVGWLVVG